MQRSEERTCCFEVSTPDNRSMIFQAETEEELLAWIRVFENAKTHALDNSQNAKAKPEVKAEMLVVEDKLEYPTAELEELARNVDGVLLMSCPYTLPTTSDEENVGGRLYYTLNSIHLVPFVEKDQRLMFPLSSIKALELKRESLYPQLIIETKEKTLQLALMATVEESNMVERLPQAIFKYGNDPQDLIDRLYHQNGKSFQNGGEEDDSNVEGYDMRIPPEIPDSPVSLPEIPGGVVELKELDAKINLPAHVLFEMLFVKNELMAQLHTKRRSLDLEIGEWSTQPPEPQSIKILT